ncbi:MAG: ImmA/IrrE family metallo-endopeptidase [Clostridiales bacterium]|jgi:predicted RNase H-like HicB family nuclease|nr:ImmA/IrrE family metallo-endopeptidase [Clostridiales bacterium]
MAIYKFPATLTKENDGGYLVNFCDIDGCFTDGNSLEQALSNAKDALCLFLYHMEQGNKKINSPSNPTSLKCSKNESIHVISCNTGDYKSNRDCVKEILVKNNLWSIPVDLNQLAKNEGFDIKLLPMIDEEGSIEVSKDKKIIKINVDDYPKRRTFTLAHELGHWFKDGYGKELFACRDDKIRNEYNAHESEINSFASELLMPYELMSQFIIDLNDMDMYTEDNIEYLIADKFNVSKEAARIRFKKFVKEAIT